MPTQAAIASVGSARGIFLPALDVILRVPLSTFMLSRVIPEKNTLRQFQFFSYSHSDIARSSTLSIHAHYKSLDFVHTNFISLA